MSKVVIKQLEHVLPPGQLVKPLNKKFVLYEYNSLTKFYNSIGPYIKAHPKLLSSDKFFEKILLYTNCCLISNKNWKKGKYDRKLCVFLLGDKKVVFVFNEYKNDIYKFFKPVS